MSALDDFIAADPSGRNIVDLMGGRRWTEYDIRIRTEEVLAGTYPLDMQRIFGSKIDIYTLQRQRDIAATLGLPADPDLVLSPYTLSAAEKQELSAYGTMRVLCGALKDLMWARAQRLSAAMDFEDTRTALATLPPPPEDGSPDPLADARVALQAVLDAAPQDTLDLVAERDAWRASLNPPDAP